MTDSILWDIRIAVRALRRSPVFATAAVVMLAVGIGAATAMFAVVNAVFLTPLVLDRPEELRKVSWTSRARAFARPQFGAYADAIIARGGTLDQLPYSLYERLREPGADLPRVACAFGGNLRIAGERGFFNALLVSGDYSMVYAPYRLVGPAEPMTFTLRTTTDAEAMAPALRRVTSELRTAVGGDVTTGVEYRDRTLMQVRALTAAVGLFGCIAVLLASLGVYGTLAYRVYRRTNEIGVRVALGAEPPHLARTLFGTSLAAVASGIVVGALTAAVLASPVRDVLFGVSATDPWTIGAAAVVLAATALLAATPPLIRACRINPVQALRHE